jgi:hypothetical protein
MNPQELLTTLLHAIVSVAVPIITRFAVQWLTAQSERVKTLTANETAARYIAEAADAVTTAVAYTQQTFVDVMKEYNEWTPAAMREACHRAMDKATSLLTADAIRFIGAAYGDINGWLRAQIEAEVALQK